MLATRYSSAAPASLSDSEASGAVLFRVRACTNIAHWVRVQF